MNNDARAGGLLGLLKPPGMTSHDAVAFLRKRLGTARIGHAGTLDPAAAGVLPILVGEATRLAPFLDHLPKSYRAIILFGLATDTADLTGRVIAEYHAPPPSDAAMAVAAAGLVGKVLQRPPAYSARRVDGRRLYQLARAGQVAQEDLDRASREVEVLAASVVASGPLGWGRHASLPSVTLDVACSKGTYVRELATRLGQTLARPATLALLVRTQAAGLGLAQCITPDALWVPAAVQLPWSARFGSCWRDPAQALAFMPAVVVSDAERRRVRDGLPLEPPAIDLWIDPEEPASLRCEAQPVSEEWVRILGRDGFLVAVAALDRRSADASQWVLRPRRVFSRHITSN